VVTRLTALHTRDAIPGPPDYLCGEPTAAPKGVATCLFARMPTTSVKQLSARIERVQLPAIRLAPDARQR
jgi:hypothetical protein